MSPHTLFNVIAFNSLAGLFPISIFVCLRFPGYAFHMFSLFLGLLTGILAVQTDDMPFPVLLLLVFGMFSGFQRPKAAWQYATLLAMWIPSLELVAKMIGFNVRGGSGFGGSLIAFVPAFAGAYLGAVLRRFAPIADETRQMK